MPRQGRETEVLGVIAKRKKKLESGRGASHSTPSETGVKEVGSRTATRWREYRNR
jgi:hypothetical protein